MTNDILLAMITYSRDAHIWRLRLPATSQRPNGGMVELPGFSGNIANSKDADHIDAILRTEGYTPDMNRWRDENGDFVIPIVRYEHP